MSLPEPVAAIAERANPFKGLAYYERQDAGRFAGRQKDIEAVAAGILRTRTFVVYGRSGLGKTSLLLAGVLPRLAGQGCRTVDVRLLEDPLGDLRRALAGSSDATEDLATLIERAGGEHLLVIVFDQFEEFFIRFADQADPAGGLRSGDELDRQARQLRIAQREAFIEEIGRLAADARLNLRLVFSLREDWIAEMGDFADAVPEIAQHMYRLLPLTSFGVRQAIVETLRSAGTDFDSRLVSALVDALADVHFDPVMLQVLGSEVWERARARTPEGEAVRPGLDDFEAIGGVRQVFRGYLDQVQAEIEPADGRRKILTRAVLDALISEKRTKLALSRDDLLRQYFVITGPELDEVLGRLSHHRLIRSDPRGDIRWYELVHERLIGAIQEWFESDLDFVNFRGARNFLASSCRNRGWRENPGLLLNRGQLDDTVGPYKDLLHFSEEERLFLVSSAIYASSRELELWSELAGKEVTDGLLDRFLDAEGPGRLHAAEAAGRVASQSGHFARRCLDLALHDPGGLVRQTAARSFADLATAAEHRELAAGLGRRKDRQAALDVLTEVVAKEKLPVGVSLGRWTLRKARQRVYERKLGAARKAIRDRSMRGAWTGLLAALAWSFTVGLLLTRVFLYEVVPSTGLKSPWAWPLGIGAYLAAALLLGSWTGWSTAQWTARAALRRGHEGITFRALTDRPVPPVCVALVVAGGARLWWQTARGQTTFTVLFEPVWLPAAFALAGVLLWVACFLIAFLPAIWPGGGRRRSTWLWAGVWSFGAALFPLLAPVLILPIEPRFTRLMTRLFGKLRDFAETSLLFFWAATIVLGGLILFCALLSAARSLPGDDGELHLGKLPRQRSRWARRTWKSLSMALAVVAAAILISLFGLDAFLAPRQELGNADIPVQVKIGAAQLNARHVRLVIPDRPSAPRLAEISLPDLGMWVSAEGKGALSDILVLQPGQSRRLAFGGTDGQAQIRPDRPLSGPLPLTGHQLVVARLSAEAADWSAQLSGLEHLRAGRRTFYLGLGNGFQGGEWCEDAGLRFRVSGIKHRFMQQPTCLSNPQSVVFDQEVPWTSTDAAPEVHLEAWRREALFRHGQSLIARWNLDVSRVATYSTLYDTQDGVHPPAAADAENQAGVVNLWSLDRTTASVPLKHPTVVVDARFSPDGKLLGSLDAEGKVRVWKVDQPDKPVVTLDNREPAGFLKLSNSGLGTISSGSNTVRIWQLDGSTTPFVFPHHQPVSYLAFSPDGARFATGDTGGTIRVRNADRNGKTLVLQSPECLPSSVYYLRFSPDGGWILSASANVACIWNANRKDKPVILNHEDMVRSVVFSPEFSSPRVLTSSADGSARLWRRDGQLLRTFRHPGAVRNAAFSFDGSRIATAASDGVRVWDLTPPSPPIFFALREGAYDANLSSDGKRLIAFGTSGPARVWDLSHPVAPQRAGDVFLFLRVSSKRELEPSSSQDAP